MKECIHIFEKNSKTVVQEILNSVRENKEEQLLKHVQKLKGMIYMFPGFDAILVCEDLESTLLHGCYLDVPSKVVFLQEKIEFMQSTLKTYNDTYLT